jgi:hypothetical protein
MRKLIATIMLLALAGIAIVVTVRHQSVGEALSRSDGYSSPAAPANLSATHTADSVSLGLRF